MLSCLAGSAQAHNCPSIPMPPPILNLLSLAKMEHSAHSFPVDLTRYLFSWKMLHIILRPLCPTLKNVALTHVSRENVLQAVNDIQYYANAVCCKGLQPWREKEKLQTSQTH